MIKKDAIYTQEELSNIVKLFYNEQLKGESVVNKETGIVVVFNAIGRNKTSKGLNSKGHRLDYIKVKAFFKIKKLIIDYNLHNCGFPKEKHIKKYNAKFFMNLISEIEIDNERYIFYIPCMVRKSSDTAYYSIYDFEKTEIRKMASIQ